MVRLKPDTSSCFRGVRTLSDDIISSMNLHLFTSARFADHLTPPGHPERIERAEVMQMVASGFRKRGGSVVEPTPATRADLVRVHDPEYVSLIAETAGRAAALDPDTYTSPLSYEVACLAAGAAVNAVDYVLDSGDGARACALVRPPGHHAERNRAMGFCLFNNIAVAAAHARARGVERVAIVDFDVHHGNGTQRTFYHDASVLFISSHQFPYYPGSGAAEETGEGDGEGFTINLPLAAGAQDSDYELIYGEIAFPVLRQFRPDLILISAGVDAHADDPLAGMRLTASEFGRLTSGIVAVADEHCDGRVVAVSEGGYDLKAFADSMCEVIGALEGDTPAGDFNEANLPAPRGTATLNEVRPHLRAHWQI